MDELQKSYEQFLHRMERYKNKRTLVVLFKLLCIGPVLIVRVLGYLTIIRHPAAPGRKNCQRVFIW
jgi:hypothetical protein